MTTTGSGHPASPRVSVVVPVYNPGPSLEPCVASLLGQSMPTDDVEIILVDDGSTDGTDARLDELAALHRNVRVIHIPASGAPGKPRNVGLDAARGTYVHFVDADDVLARRALEWLTGMADRNDSDIVIGKYASATLDRSQQIFNRNRDRATFRDTPELLTASWAPGKLFRVATLRREGIAFPEGWRWMEDQLFLLRAYFAARNISVFADAPCYYFVRREEGGHLSAEDIEPETRVGHLCDVFDVIQAQVPPGALRDRLVRRFYRANILSTFDERFLAASPASRREIVEHFGAFAASRVEPAIDGTFTSAYRVRARLLRAGDTEGLVAFTRRLDELDVHVSVNELRWRGGRLVVDVTGELRRRGDGSPLTVVVRDSAATLDPALTGDPDDRVEADIQGIRAQVSMKNADTAVEWIVPGPPTAVLRDAGAHPGGGRHKRPTVSVSVEIDPDRIGPAAVRLANGRWSVALRWRGLGIRRRGQLHEPAGAFPPLLPAVVGNPATLVVPRLGADGLSLEVGARPLPIADWRQDQAAVLRDGRVLEVALPILAARGAGGSSATIVLRGPNGDRAWPADVGPDLGRLRLRSRDPDFGRGDPDPADRPLLARLGPPFDLEVQLGVAHVDGAGRLRVVGAADARVVARARRRLAWHVRSTRDGALAEARGRAVAIALRLPAPMRRLLVGAYRGVRRRRT